MRRLLILYSFSLIWLSSYGQLAKGAPAPDFSVTDIFNAPYSLYAKMGSKGAVVDFSATWCAPCWQFHEDQVLKNLYNNLSADATVVFLEGDFGTNTNCLYGLTGCNSGTHGDWVTGEPYQIVDLSASNGPNVKSNYAVTYFPTVYVISPDKRAWEIINLDYQVFTNWLSQSFKLNVTAGITHCNCGNNGKINLNVVGGYGNLAFQWNNGASSKDLNNIPGGSYSVTITDENGYFKSFGPWTINNPPKQVDIVNSILEHVTCFNELTGSIEIQVGFGTPPYSYNWSNGKNTKNIKDLMAGDYIVTLTDNVGCTRSKAYTIIEPARIILSATSIKEECDESNGSINAKALGGIPPYRFDIGFGPQQATLFKDLKGGKDYFLTLTDENDCKESIKVNVDATHKPIADAGSPKSFSDCLINYLILDGGKSSRGNAFSYLWTTSDGNIINGKETLFPEIDKQGRYELMVTDMNNKCVDVESVHVSDDRVFPNVKTGGDTLLNCLLTEIELNGTSDSNHVFFYWKKAYDTTFLKEGKSFITIDSGSFIFHVKDTNNFCISKDTFIVNKDQTKPIAYAIPQNDISCKNAEILIDGAASSQGTDFIYEWTTSNGNIVNGSNSLLALVNKGGDYQLKVQNQINFCDQTTIANVREQINITTLFSQSISDLSVQFEDQSEGVPTSWHWDFGETGSMNNTSTEKNPLHTYASSGVFNVCLVAENDCGKVKNCNDVYVGIYPPLRVIAQVEHQKCYGDSIGAIRLDISGGLQPYSYQWSNKETTKDIEHLVAGIYSVNVTDQQGTRFEDVFLIDQPEEIQTSVIITHATLGQNNGKLESTIFGGIGPYSIVWFHDQLPSGDTNLSPGDYYCRIIDASGCVKMFGPFIIKSTTSSEETADKKDELITFNLMPNPVNDYGHINLKFASNKSYRIDLINIFGKSIWSGSYQNSSMNMSMDTNNFAKGIYFVVLQTQNSKKIRKWIIN